MTLYGNWDRRRFTRREALAAGGVTAAALSLGAARTEAAPPRESPYGPLIPRPDDIALPHGFNYRIVSPVNSRLSTGKPVPGDHDGMAAFRGPHHTTVLVRNHELGFRDEEVPGVIGDHPYDADERGGTTAVILDRNRKVVRDFVTSSGTANNCSGGPTPWGTWLTCEEDRDQEGIPHGFVFEVPWWNPEGPLSRTPIKEMGFFSHEAVGVDPATGIVYMTEDDFRRTDTVPGSDPRISFLYRFRPNRFGFPGALLNGGVLEVAAIEGRSGATADFFDPGESFKIIWKQVPWQEPHDAALALGAIQFNRLEGAEFAGGAFWFDDTVGGEAQLGQMFRYVPATNTLELFIEATTENEMDGPDNVTVTPWGDVWFCEDDTTARPDRDAGKVNRVMGITPDGRTYEFARTEGSEFAGPTFSPDGHTFFVNAQDRGVTYVIWGPFARVNRARQRQMAHAAPPPGLGPKISGALVEAAERHALTALEAAAFDRLGVPLV